MRDIFSAILLAFFLTPILIGTIGTVAAQVMESTNYRVESDSINFGGGRSTSSSYTLESTAGEVATGESTSTIYKLKAGYQQMHEVYLALSSASDIIMSPSISGISGGTANGSTTVTVTTDGAAGYTLSIKAQNAPAMQSDLDTIADYVPAGANPDYAFTTGSSDSHFGYSPYGNDVVARFLDNGASCNTGSSNATSSCWDGLATSTEIIASGGANHPSGVATTIYFRVGIGGSVVQTAGTYVATTTLTLLPL